MGNAIYITASALALTSYTYIFIPPLYLFTQSTEHGMTWINHIYPYPQPIQPLLTNPLPIYTHIYLNSASLLLLFLIVLHAHPTTVSVALHRSLTYLYTALLIPGTVASLVYASRQDYGDDGGKAGFFAFAMMALVTVSTLLTALYYACVRRNPTLHREWAMRHFAVLFGNGVVFRVLARTYLVWMAGGAEGQYGWGADFYASWCQMIYLAWLLPLALTEWYLSWERHDAQQKSRQRNEAIPTTLILHAAKEVKFTGCEALKTP